MTTTPGTAADPHSGTLSALTAALGEGAFTTATFRDNLRLYVAPVRLIELLTALKTKCGFGFLSEVGGVDYLEYPGRDKAKPRFEVHYVVRNHDTMETLVVKVGLEEAAPAVASVVPLWPGANWMEREVFDMYGIRFEGHPDLRRILMPEGFAAFPLRKDYPLRGRGERHNFPRITRGES